MRRWKIIGSIALSSAAILACQVVIGLEKPVGVEPPSTDSGPADRCAHAAEPSRPDASDPTAVAPQWLAVEAYQLPYLDDAGVGAGLDLDDSCTCNPDPSNRDPRDGAPSCVPPRGNGACDGDGGVDDAFGTGVARYFSSFTAYDPRLVGNEDILKGYRTTMVWISGYNGKADDDTVSVALVASNGIHSSRGSCNDGRPRPVPDATPNESSTPYYPPLFDGCDSWTMAPSDVAEGTLLPVDFVTDAYVTRGVLVASFDKAPFSVAGATVAASGARLVARITPLAGERFALDGFIAGRLLANELIAAASRLEMTAGDASGSFCDDALFGAFVDRLCRSLDIRANEDNRANDDNGGLPCDGISIVLGIHAATAQADPHTMAIVAPSLGCANGAVPTCP